MNRTKISLGIVALAALSIWSMTPALGNAQETFLKGKVNYLDKENLSLEKKFELAQKEFQKTGKGNAYFTGYTFLCTHEIHYGGDRSSSEQYRIAVKGNEIKVRRAYKGKRSGLHIESEEGNAPAGIVLLHRASNNRAEIMDVHLIDLEDTYEFNDVPIYWFGDEDTGESFRLLEKEFESGSSNLQKTLIFVISSHADPKTYDFLRRTVLGNYEREVRKSAIFWLGNYKDSRSLNDLKEIYKKEKDTELRKQVIFAIQLSNQPEAISELIKIAKTADSREIRKSAIFWVGQKASEECIKTLRDVVEESKDDVDVKKSAVFAISQLPTDRAVPILIDIAKKNKSPAVRKNAIFWLGQKDDERALEFFEDILLKKN